MKSIKRYPKRKRKEVYRNRLTVSYRQKLIKNQTDSERKFHELLKEVKKLKVIKNLSVSFQKRWVSAYEIYISDFYFKNHNITIEIDGGYHNNPKRKSKDLQKEGYLLLKGIKTFRLTNEESYRIDNVNKMIKYLNSININ